MSQAMWHRTRPASMTRCHRGVSLTRYVALLAIALILVGSEATALMKQGADGDSCTIDRDGLKIPGTKKGTKWCSVFDDKDCVEMPSANAPMNPLPNTSSLSRAGANAPIMRRGVEAESPASSPTVQEEKEKTSDPR